MRFVLVLLIASTHSAGKLVDSDVVIVPLNVSELGNVTYFTNSTTDTPITVLSTTASSIFQYESSTQEETIPELLFVHSVSLFKQNFYSYSDFSQVKGGSSNKF